MPSGASDFGYGKSRARLSPVFSKKHARRGISFRRHANYARPGDTDEDADVTEVSPFGVT